MHAKRVVGLIHETKSDRGQNGMDQSDEEGPPPPPLGHDGLVLDHCLPTNPFQPKTQANVRRAQQSKPNARGETSGITNKSVKKK